MLTLAGADGYRLGVERLTVAEKTAETRDAVISGPSLKKLMRVLRQRKDQEVGIRFPAEQTNSMAFVVPNIAHPVAVHRRDASPTSPASSRALPSRRWSSTLRTR